MDIAEKFMNLNFLDEKVILNNKKILQENFNINFDEILLYNKKLNDLIREVTISTEKIKEITDIFNDLHEITVEVLGEYNTNIDDYFRTENTKGGEYVIKNYLFENLKSNIYLYKEYKNIDKKEISQIEAVKKYIKTQDENTIKFFGLDEEQEEDKEKIERYTKKISNNLRKLKEKQQIIDIFHKKYLKRTRNKYLYTITSNVFINMVENINKNNSITTMKDIEELKRLKFDYYNNNQKSTNNIISNEKSSYSDLYFYERINNNHFINSLYFEVKKLVQSEKEQQDLFEYLFPIIYLPSVIANKSIIMHMVYIYIYNNYYKYKGDFEKQIKKMCLNLAFFTIPIYNMIFSIVLYSWCKKVKQNISNVVEKYVDKNQKNFINNYKDELNSYNILNQSNKEINALLEKIQFTVLTINVNERINFKIYEKNNIIVKMSESRECIRELIFDDDIFFKIFKEIILKIIFESDDI